MSDGGSLSTPQQGMARLEELRSARKERKKTPTLDELKWMDAERAWLLPHHKNSLEHFLGRERSEEATESGDQHFSNEGVVGQFDATFLLKAMEIGEGFGPGAAKSACMKAAEIQLLKELSLEGHSFNRVPVKDFFTAFEKVTKPFQLLLPALYVSALDLTVLFWGAHCHHSVPGACRCREGMGRS